LGLPAVEVDAAMEMDAAIVNLKTEIEMERWKLQMVDAECEGAERLDL